MGVLLRPNALLAAPVLTAYLVWPARFSFRRTAVLFVPAALGSFAIVQFVYYGALGATRQHPLQSIMIFDLGGISHFAQENQYPVDWSETQNAMLLNGCYQPTQWDIYWRLEPCDFVMGKIEREQHLFGTSAIPKAWLSAVLRHPLAYMQHRLGFMWNFLAADNLTTVGLAVPARCSSPSCRRPASSSMRQPASTACPLPGGVGREDACCGAGGRWPAHSPRRAISSPATNGDCMFRSSPSSSWSTEPAAASTTLLGT